MAESMFRTMREILRGAIEHEQESFEYYHSAALQAEDPELRRFLMGLAEMEKDHERQLKEQLERLENQLWVEKALSL